MEIYTALEPDGADTWNPLARDRELEYRIALYRRLCRGLRHLRAPMDLRVLDVGCGNGRSTRVYLDFGLRPEQLTGVDLRRGAIARARESHPAIRFLTCRGSALPFADGSFDWVSLASVFSTIPTSPGRRHLAAEAVRVLADGGHLFYFDGSTAHRLAISPMEHPGSLFPDLAPVFREDLRLPPPRAAAGVTPVPDECAPLATHRCCLFCKPSGTAGAPASSK